MRGSHAHSPHSHIYRHLNRAPPQVSRTHLCLATRQQSLLTVTHRHFSVPLLMPHTRGIRLHRTRPRRDLLCQIRPRPQPLDPGCYQGSPGLLTDHSRRLCVLHSLSTSPLTSQGTEAHPRRSRATAGGHHTCALRRTSHSTNSLSLTRTHRVSRAASWAPEILDLSEGDVVQCQHFVLLLFFTGPTLHMTQ